MKQNGPHSAFHTPHSALRRLLALVVAEAFLCSSILPAWATSPTNSHLRPASVARDGARRENLIQELKPTVAKDGGEKGNLPKGWALRVVQAEQDPLSGGLIYTMERLKGHQYHPFEEGIIELVSRYPVFMNLFGISGPFEAGNFVRAKYPNISGLNYRIDRLKDTPQEVSLRLWSPIGQIDRLTYARHWVGGEIPLSQEGIEHFHDMMHLTGFLLLPREIVEQSQKQIRFLLTLFDDEALKQNEMLRGLVHEQITYSRTAVQFLHGIRNRSKAYCAYQSHGSACQKPCFCDSRHCPCPKGAC